MVHLPYLLVVVFCMCMIDHITAFQPRTKVSPTVLHRQPIQSQINDESSQKSTTTFPLHSIVVPFTPVSSFMSIGTAVAVMWSNVAVAHAEVRNVFQPTLDQDTVQSSSFGAVYLLGAVIPYFVLNAFIAPKLGLSKEVNEDDPDNMTPPNNKSPF